MLEERLREYYHSEVAGLEATDLLPGVLAAGRRARRRARVLWTGALAAAAVALVAGLAGLSVRAPGPPAMHRPGASAAVPGVVMMAVPAAERLLAHDGFTVKVAREAGLEPLRRVIFQHPAAGSRVRPGTTVTLVISAGPVTGTGSP